MKASPYEISVLCAEPAKYDKLDLAFVVREGKATQRLGIWNCSSNITLYQQWFGMLCDRVSLCHGSAGTHRCQNQAYSG